MPACAPCWKMPRSGLRTGRRRMPAGSSKRASKATSTASCRCAPGTRTSTSRTARSAFEDRAIEFAMAFELSPPSWEPSLSLAVPAKTEEPTEADLVDGFEAESLKWSGVMTGSLAPPLAKLADSTHSHAVVAVDMSEVERIDFVCAGALLNHINRIESQR